MPRIAYLGSAVPLDLERRMLGELGRDDVEVYEVDSDNAGRPARGSLSGADALVIEWGKADARTFVAAPQLRCVSMMAIGHDNIDDAAATAHGCWVTNVPDYCTYDVALHTLGLIVDLYKKITWFDRQVRDGVWDDMAGYDAPRPQGQTAGLVFFGSIAQALTPMLKSIGMEVMAYAPTKSPAFLASHGVAKAESLEELLEKSDVVSLHCPLVDVTRDIICVRTLRLMKPTAFFVNTSRGGCVVEEDLAQALTDGTIRAAAVDVKRDETNAKSPLVGLDNCIVTPHCAYHSSDSYTERRTRALKNALEALDGLKPGDAVNELSLAG